MYTNDALTTISALTFAISPDDVKVVWMAMDSVVTMVTIATKVNMNTKVTNVAWYFPSSNYSKQICMHIFT
jgi:hypothetical protein